MAPPPLALFAVAAPGLEPLVAAELVALGARDVAVEAGGVAFAGDEELLHAANVGLRVASRVLLRLGRFHAAAFHELERHARRLPWSDVLDGRTPVSVRATCHRSRLYHSAAVAERVAAASGAEVRRGGEAVDDGDAGDGGDDGARAQLVVVRMQQDVCTVSVDASGELLHRRGWRQALARAPLRETLAAALLLGAGWAGDAPLCDPMCGSGTIVIEAALLARRIAPGLGRRFACERWPAHHAARLATVVERARAAILPRARVAIVGSDRDAGAIAAARANAERAGVAADVELRACALSDAAPPPPRHRDGAPPADPLSVAARDAGAANHAAAGLLATNPPYGVRVGERHRLGALYATLGDVARGRFPGWTVALLSPGAAVERATRLRFATRFATRNGGIAVRLALARA